MDLISTKMTNSYSSKIFVTPRTISRVRKKSVKLSRISVSLFTFAIINLMVLHQVNAFCPKRCNCDELKLEVTCLESTGLQAVPHTFNPLTSKIVINYANATIFSGLDLYEQLEHLDLSHNNITTIDFKVLNQNSRLQSLNSSHNMIVNLLDTTVNPRRRADELGLNQILDEASYRRMVKFEIKHLFLSYNRLMTLGNFVFVRMPNLRHLDLSYNQLISIDSLAFVANHKMEILNLRGNRLLHVPTLALTSMSLRPLGNTFSDFDVRQLKHLDLSENPINQIQAEALPTMGQFMEFYMNSCDLHRVDEKAFRNTPSLLLLSLENNKLSVVPTETFQDINQLRALHLSSNPIAQILPRAFSPLGQLQDLTLNNCSLRQLNDGSFDGLSNLRRLEISSNRDLDKIGYTVFATTTNVRYLNLNSNSIKSLRSGIPNLPHLTILDVRNNPLECHCDLQWLGQWLRDFDNKTVKIQQKQQQISQLQQSQQSQNLTLNSDINQGATQSQEQGSINYSEYEQQNPQKIRKRGAASDETRDMEYDSWLNDATLTKDLVDLKCNGPAALKGRRLIELHIDKLECLEPMSQLHVTIGLVVLGAFTTLILLLCVINVCLRRKYLLHRLKNNLIMSANKIDSSENKFYDKKFNEMNDLKFTSSIYTINPSNNNATTDLYDTNLSYGQVDGDGSLPIYHQPEYDCLSPPPLPIQVQSQDSYQKPYTDL